MRGKPKGKTVKDTIFRLSFITKESVERASWVPESVDYGSRMTDAQKKKFHDLKKKMTDGPEHQKIMRKNQSRIKSDDEFHNLVLKKAMSEEVELDEARSDDDWVHIARAGSFYNPKKDTIVGYSKAAKDPNRSPLSLIHI